MRFRTEIEISRLAPEAQISYKNRILTLGSCFAGEIGARLREARFRCTTNPTGVLFNPASISEALNTFANPNPVRRGELCEMNGLWHHFGFHGSFSDTNANTALECMNAARQIGAEALRTADRVILTLGTAWVYKHNGGVVANCHRHPASEFIRHRLSTAEITSTLSALLDGPLTGKHVILTVSPVRHPGDGLEANFLSKATLRTAIAEVTDRHSNAIYFPSYEIMNDDLRDYRFYTADMVHPTPQAVDYIWEKFSDAVLTAQTQTTAEAAARIVSAAMHRPQHVGSEAFRTFCCRMLSEIETLPSVDLSEEKLYFEKYIQ